MKRCFGDTFFYLAFLNTRDEAHRRAVDFLRSQEPFIVTTAWVLTEVADALARSRRATFGRLLAAMDADGRTEIVGASQTLFDAGVAMYVARLDKEWSLTDCISFAVMEERGLAGALTADHHFEQAGFRALLA